MKESHNIALLYFLIFSSELAKAFFVISIPATKIYFSMSLLFLFYSLQFFSAPIQGGISDTYCRRKSILVAFTAIVVSLGARLFFLGHWEALLFGVILLGLMGNGDVLARAAILDFDFGKKRRISMGISFVVQALAWLSVTVTSVYFNEKNSVIILLTLNGLGFLLPLLFFEDQRDKDNLTKISLFVDLKEVLHFFKNNIFTIGIIGLLIAETAFQLVYLKQDSFYSGILQSRNTAIFAIGMVVGATIQMLIPIRDKTGVLVGVILSLVPLFLYTFLNMRTGIPKWISSWEQFGLFTLGSGVYLPCIYSYFSKKHRVHEQGKVFGLLDSTQTGGEVISSLILLFPFVSFFFIRSLAFVAFIVAFSLLRKVPSLK